MFKRKWGRSYITVEERSDLDPRGAFSESVFEFDEEKLTFTVTEKNTVIASDGGIFTLTKIATEAVYRKNGGIACLKLEDLYHGLDAWQLIKDENMVIKSSIENFPLISEYDNKFYDRQKRIKGLSPQSKKAVVESVDLINKVVYVANSKGIAMIQLTDLSSEEIRSLANLKNWTIVSFKSIEETTPTFLCTLSPMIGKVEYELIGVTFPVPVPMATTTASVR